MFGLGSKKILGIDLGTAGIKIVEVKNQGGKPHLSNYAWMNVSGIKGIENTHSLSDELLSGCLRRMIKEGGFDAKKANVSIPASGGLITLIEFPASMENDLDQAIRFEAHKYIPSALEDVVFSWDIVGRTGGKTNFEKNSENKDGEIKLDGGEDKAPKADQGKLEVLLVAASKNRVEKYERIVQGAGIELESIELESFSLARSLIGKDAGNYLIVDIGHKICNIILSEKGFIKINRNIDVGGRDLTRIVSSNMNLDDARSEQIKRKTNFFKEDSFLKFPPLEIIIAEAKRVLESYYGQNNQTKLDGIVLSGGSSSLLGLDKYLEEKIGSKVIIGNPFSRLVIPDKDKDILNKLKSSFSVAVGLAIRNDKDI